MYYRVYNIFSRQIISWCSRKQLITQSITEAEYVAAIKCCKELVSKDIIRGTPCEEVRIELNIDNQSAISLIKNRIVNKKIKHIEVNDSYLNLRKIG